MADEVPLAEITEDTEIVITRGNTPIARLLPTDVDVLIRTLSGETITIQVKTGGDNASPDALIRRPNLHPEAFVNSDDFLRFTMVQPATATTRSLLLTSRVQRP